MSSASVADGGAASAGSPDAAPPPPALGSLAARATVTHISAAAPHAETTLETSRRAPPVSAAGTRAAPGRNKVTLEKGFSQVDWMRLTRTHPDLAGLKGSAPRRFTLEEVRAHSSETDCWTVLDGRVYNLTHYIPFHPGGKPILMKGAGRDCTALFRKYHPWVNAHFMLAKCLLGLLHESEPGAPASGAGLDDEDDDEDDDEGE